MTNPYDLRRTDHRGNDDTRTPWPGDDPWGGRPGDPRRAGPSRAVTGPLGGLIRRYRTARLGTRVTVDVTAAAAVMAVVASAASVLPDGPRPAVVSTRSTTVVSVSTTAPATGVAPTTARRAPEPPSPTTERPGAGATPQATSPGPGGKRGAEGPSHSRARPSLPPYPDCLPAWLDGAAPLRPGDPGYSADLEDEDGDGILCEHGRSDVWGGSD